jgi:hypothetical protein
MKTIKQYEKETKQKFTENKELTKLINWVVINWDKIPERFKQNIMPNKYSNPVTGLKKEGHVVILLVDRQKPSVESCCDFDEERLGINRFGEIVMKYDRMQKLQNIGNTIFELKLFDKATRNGGKSKSLHLCTECKDYFFAFVSQEVNE